MVSKHGFQAGNLNFAISNDSFDGVVVGDGTAGLLVGQVGSTNEGTAGLLVGQVRSTNDGTAGLFIGQVGLTNEGTAGPLMGQYVTEESPADFFGGPVNGADGGDSEFAWNGSGTGTTANVATSNQDINGLLNFNHWNTTAISFSFPTSAAQYGSYSHLNGGTTVDETTTFRSVNAQMAAEARWVLTNPLGATYFSVSMLNPTENSATPGTATIRIAMTDSSQPTAYAYYPSSSIAGGDVWMGTQTGGNAMTSPVIGNYAWASMMHEIGHALGLKHGQDVGGVANTAMTAAHDAMEYSIMTYRSYVGGPTTGYSNETWGYAQSLMMYDIAAIQSMYGARFNTTAHTYSWSATTGQQFIDGVAQGLPGGNRVFMTVWDGSGGGVYDFSNYTTNMNIDLTPGGYSTLSAVQLANLGNGNFAHGNVYNALQYNNDPRSLIQDVHAGTGNDTILGNAANNTFYGGGGTDTIDGGAGHDVTVFNFTSSSATIVHNANGSWTITGVGQSETLTNVELAQFTDRGIVLQETTQNDFTSNGSSDVLFRNNTTGDTGFYEITNGSVTGWHSVGGSSTAYTIVGTGDFNGDGVSDILFRNNATGDNGFYQLNSNGSTQGWHGLGGSSTAYNVVGIGDFNRDGISDILFRNNATGDTGFSQLTANGTLQGWHGIGGSSTTYNVVGVGDFNRDGVSDILFRNNATGDTGFYQINSNGTVQDWHGLGGSSTAYTVVGIGDFNRDGVSDILFRNNSTGDIGFDQVNANGTLQGWHGIGGSQTSYSIVDVGDYNSDGIADILFRNNATGDTGFYQLNTDGTLQGWHGIGTSSTSYLVV